MDLSLFQDRDKWLTLVKTAMTLPSDFIKFCDSEYLAFHEANLFVLLVVSVRRNGRRKKMFSMVNSIKEQ
jgi:hypothetical protein